MCKYLGKKIVLSVVSPSYNKGKTIQRLYDSLIRQSCHDFEWIVINDGSTDNTVEIVNTFQTDSFPIRFVDKKNEGLNRTYNLGVKMALGDFMVRVDPDDYLTDDAVERILNYCSLISADERLCGIAFLTKYSDGKIVGRHPYINIHRSNFADYRLTEGGKGDRVEVVKTEIFKQYLMPEIEGEKFCLESYMWNSIAQQYDALYIPYAIYIREYNESSITSNLVRVMAANPKGAVLTYSQCIELLIERNYQGKKVKKEILKYSINLFRFGFNAPKELCSSLKEFPLLITMIGIVPGLILYLVDRLFPNFVYGILAKIRKYNPLYI